MYLQEIVEVAIGLVFSWLLLSVAVLQIQEIIATAMKKRARDLEAAIGNMLKNEDYLAKFYEHPLIQGLIEPMSRKNANRLAALKEKESEGLNWWERFRKWSYTREENKVKKRLPSYIPPANFSAALFDVVVKAGTEDSPIKSTLDQLNNEIEKLGEGDKEAAKALLDEIQKFGQLVANSEAGIEFQESLKKELKKQVKGFGRKYPQLSTFTEKINAGIDDYSVDLKPIFSSDQLLEQVNEGIKSLFKKDPESNLGKSLRSLIAGVNEYATETDKAIAIGRKNMETWFDNTMDRMTGWYKRWAQAWAFGIGLFLAIALNVDSISIARELWHNPATRQASAVYIQNFVEEKTEDEAKLKESDLNVINAEIQKINFPVGWDLKQYTKSDKEKVRLFAASDETAGICPSKINFVPEKEKEYYFCYEITNPPRNGVEVYLKSLGFIFTALAAMLGAPFWFDVLKKLVNVRNTGANPKEKPEEENKQAK